MSYFSKFGVEELDWPQPHATPFKINWVPSCVPDLNTSITSVDLTNSVVAEQD